MGTVSTPQEIAERALAEATAAGCTVIVKESTTANLRWAGNTLTTNGLSRGRSLTVVAFVDTAGGTAAGVYSTSQVDLDTIPTAVAHAERAARETGPAEDAHDLISSTPSPSPWEEGHPATSATVFDEFTPALGEALARARLEGRELFGYAEHAVETTYLASSAGLRLRHSQPTGKVELTGKSHDRSRSTYVGTATRDFRDVDVSALEAEVVRRLGWADRRVELAAGHYDTILPPGAVADLLIYAYWTMAARHAAEGRTVFSRPGGGTRIGERLARPSLTLFSEPSRGTLACQPFVVDTASSAASSVFDSGLPLARTDWIRDGLLTSLLQTRHSADITGLPVTPAIDNLVLEDRSGSGSVEDLIASTSHGLLLTCLWYIREVDPQTLLLTGLTRDGVHVVESGEIVGTANNFRFNESPIALLDRVEAASATAACLPREWNDYFTRTSMPALRVSGFNMSSVSQAS